VESAEELCIPAFQNKDKQRCEDFLLLFTERVKCGGYRVIEHQTRDFFLFCP